MSISPASRDFIANYFTVTVYLLSQAQTKSWFFTLERLLRLEVTRNFLR